MRYVLRNIAGVLTALLCFQAFASETTPTFIAFGPESYERAPGPPQIVTTGFSVPTADTDYTLEVFNGGLDGDLPRASSAIIEVNGEQVFGPQDFNQQVTYLQAPVDLQLTNEISIVIHSQPGAVVTLRILGVVTATELEITDPPNGLITQAASVNVSGTVLGASQVTVNGVVAAISAGSFVASDVPLAEGTNTLVATAENVVGETDSDTVTVRRDTSPPLIVIESPRDGDRLVTDSTVVAGTVNDIIPGATVNADDVAVTVNGIAAAVNNRTFFLPELMLAPGENTIEATAVDAAGNTKSTAISVTRELDLPGFRVLIVAGNAQSGTIGTLLPELLAVGVEDADGFPIANRPVEFRVTKGDGSLGTGSSDEARSVTLLTDAAGEASVAFTLGSRTGMGFHRVRATTPGSLSFSEFCATAEVSQPVNIAVNGMPEVRGIAGETLSVPLSAIVTDSGGNSVPGVDVVFEVTAGNGSFGGQSSVAVPTNADGIAEAPWTLGPNAGIANNQATATFAGNHGFPATFTATGVVTGAVQDTTVSGVVQDSTGEPIPGVVAVIRGTSLQATTDPGGRFVIAAVPPGGHHVGVLGSAANDPGAGVFFPDIDFAVEVISGVDNALNPPIVTLPFLDMAGAKLAGGDRDVVLEMEGVPGFSITVFARSTHVRDPQTGDLVQQPVLMSSSQVKFDKMPMPPPQGSTPLVVGTLQPGGVLLDPPARVTYPNVEGYSPGDVADIFAFHHDIGQFVNVGPGTVSEDGSVVTSDSGFGIVQSGWHCLIRLPGRAAECRGCDTDGAGAAAAGGCDDSNRCTDDDCVDGSCVHTPITTPRTCANGCESCNNGTPVPPKTEAQCCAEAPLANAGGWVVCCNCSHTACVGFSGTGPGDSSLMQCIREHEERHFPDVTDCPTGTNGCNTSGPLGFEPPVTQAQGECNAYQAEDACLKNANCGSDAACQARVDGRRAQIKGDANGFMPGCIP